jgi:hypothetical protein
MRRTRHRRPANAFGARRANTSPRPFDSEKQPASAVTPAARFDKLSQVKPTWIHLGRVAAA